MRRKLALIFGTPIFIALIVTYFYKERVEQTLLTEDKSDLISVITPLPGELVASPLIIEGEARGYWYFEGDFPVILLDENREQIALAIAQSQGEWMTEDFVPFEAELEFEAPESDMGFLILRKDNPSDIPELDDEIEIKIKFR
ncbi:Gmad2 immunoglobulin-like domain-containing protein [Patescibacteria group bacterium]|nr:Gmad2 immunoglobulin-like domain-containing protein [Patescibacteria group bacterium]MBU1683496.1 Gmad2 immunoglobulin-like domain-containing protein [Patescibacteria group bacterium]